MPAKNKKFPKKLKPKKKKSVILSSTIVDDDDKELTSTGGIWDLFLFPQFTEKYPEEEQKVTQFNCDERKQEELIDEMVDTEMIYAKMMEENENLFKAFKAKKEYEVIDLTIDDDDDDDDGVIDLTLEED